MVSKSIPKKNYSTSITLIAGKEFSNWKSLLATSMMSLSTSADPGTPSQREL